MLSADSLKNKKGRTTKRRLRSPGLHGKSTVIYIHGMNHYRIKLEMFRKAHRDHVVENFTIKTLL